MLGQAGFFDLSDKYAALRAAGDPLGRLSAVVDFELFRGPLLAALWRGSPAKGGRPPFDPVLMFKILVLQALYSLSDEGCEFQIKDGCRSSGSWALVSMAWCPMQRQSGCSANRS
jgi:transposase, IS5 family